MVYYNFISFYFKQVFWFTNKKNTIAELFYINKFNNKTLFYTVKSVVTALLMGVYKHINSYNKTCI